MSKPKKLAEVLGPSVLREFRCWSAANGGPSRCFVTPAAFTEIVEALTSSQQLIVSGWINRNEKGPESAIVDGTLIKKTPFGVDNDTERFVLLARSLAEGVPFFR